MPGGEVTVSAAHERRVKENADRLRSVLGDVLATPRLAEETLTAMPDVRLIELAQDLGKLAQHVQAVCARRTIARQRHAEHNARRREKAKRS
jgi:hypothetical protein